MSCFFAPNKLKNTIGALKIPSFEVHLGSNPTSNTLHVTLKNSYFGFGVEIAKKRHCKVSICLELAFAKF